MAIDREELLEELKLRKIVRKSIKIIKEKKQRQEHEDILNESLQKQKFRKLVRKLILAESSEPKPIYRSTGIMKLEKLLTNIVPTLESDYKDLTTDIDQRESFRSHILNAVENSLEPDKLNAESDPDVEDLNEDEIAERKKAKIRIDTDIEDDPMFIDVDRPGKEDEEKDEIDPDEKKRIDFGMGLEDQDETGRNEAYDTYQSVGSQIEKAYVSLANEKDKNMFYDYLMANLKLYFDKFEEEMQPNLPEPESEIYQKQKPPSMKQPLEESIKIDLESLNNLFN
mgnify:CR=1 FL=1